MTDATGPNNHDTLALTSIRQLSRLLDHQEKLVAHLAGTSPPEPEHFLTPMRK